MNERKQHVIHKSHQLFIKNGFQATSIQDILKYSGIAKGTFYNYFSSKNELLIAIFQSIFKQMEVEREKLLIGKAPTDIDTFTKQIELQVKMNEEGNLSALIEEVFMANDEELKQFIKKYHFKTIQWLYERFIQLFGEDKKPYLLDCAIMFFGILNQNFKFFSFAYERHPSRISAVVNYSVNRLVHIVQEVSAKKEQLIDPNLFLKHFPVHNENTQVQEKLLSFIHIIKKEIEKSPHKEQLLQYIHFIEEELNEKRPRKFIILNLFSELKNHIFIKELEEFEIVLHQFFQTR